MDWVKKDKYKSKGIRIGIDLVLKIYNKDWSYKVKISVFYIATPPPKSPPSSPPLIWLSPRPSKFVLKLSFHRDFRYRNIYVGPFCKVDNKTYPVKKPLDIQTCIKKAFDKMLVVGSCCAQTPRSQEELAQVGEGCHIRMQSTN